MELNDCIFERNEKKEIIPLADEVDFGTKNNPDVLKIRFLPITRAKHFELKQGLASNDKNEKDIDRQIILNHLIEPKFTPEQVDDMKPVVFQTLIMRIMSRSLGTTEKKMKEEPQTKWDPEDKIKKQD